MEHLKQFVSRILWEGQELGRGSGSSKKEAETQAARMALQKRLWEPSQIHILSEPVSAAVDNPVNPL